jgi:Na+/H+ antiporter NhaD/arsenite permease-like protein
MFPLNFSKISALDWQAVNWQAILAGVIFVATYAGLALGRVPGLRIDRAGLALVGASLMIASGWLSMDEAVKALDLQALALLLGMMIIVAHLKLAGFFELAGNLALSHARTPLVLLSTVVFVTGFLSAFLVNDAICLIMAPLVLSVTQALKRNPVPYLLAVAFASNAGSVATITGNPQNMIIGTASGISYLDFAKALAPVAVVALILTVALVWLTQRGEFAGRGPFAEHEAEPVRMPPWQLWKGLLVVMGVVAAFFAGVPAAMAAFVGAPFLLLSRSLDPQKLYREIDGSLLILFAGLFIVIAGVEKLPWVVSLEAVNAHLGNAWILSGVTAVTSNIASNVPAVLALKPFLANVPDKAKAWEIVAMSSTLAGNLTLLGSVANLIVVEQAQRKGTDISFRMHIVLGLPLTLLTLFFGTWWLA